nr:random slug protein 5 isoform X1 [Ipomoea batatas]
MLLGKRARQSINRTTSMTEFALDLGIEEASMAASANDFEPFDPRNAFKAGGLLRPPASDAVTARTLNRRRSADFTETAHFLRACYLCKRCLTPNRDIYMYRTAEATARLGVAGAEATVRLGSFFDDDGRRLICSLFDDAGADVAKPFLEPKTANKVSFVYSDDLNSKKIMEDLFDTTQLESAFGGNESADFDITKYAERMREDDKKVAAFWMVEDNSRLGAPPALPAVPSLEVTNSDSDSDASNKKAEKSIHVDDNGEASDVEPFPAPNSGNNGTK